MSYNPAEEGIQAAKQDHREQAAMSAQIDDFKAFVIDSMQQGIHKDFADSAAFLAASMETWIDLNSEDC